MDNVSRACHRLRNNDATLTLLNLSCEGIGSHGVKKLLQSCSCNRKLLNDRLQNCPLVALWLENNDIYPAGAEALSQLIVSSASLKYLYVAHNHINDSGAAAISSVGMTQLEVCNLASNEIGPTGARSLARSLRDESSKLKKLILEGNHLRDEGTIALAESLRGNNCLEVLDLRYNNVGIEGLSALRDMLFEDNTTLEYLLLEEDDDCPASEAELFRNQRCKKAVRLAKDYTKGCECKRCKTKDEIEYFLALNRAGRHSFGNMDIPASLWPRIMSHVSEDSPSLVYAMLKTRPDVAHR